MINNGKKSQQPEKKKAWDGNGARGRTRLGTGGRRAFLDE